MRKKEILGIFLFNYYLTLKSPYLGGLSMIISMIILCTLYSALRNLNFHIIVPFIIINTGLCIAGIPQLIVNQNTLMDVFRDVVYFMFPSLALFFNYFLLHLYRIRSSSVSLEDDAIGDKVIALINTLALIGVIIELGKILLNLGAIGGLDIRRYREVVGVGDDSVLFALIFELLIFRKDKAKSNTSVVFLGILLISVLLSFSRINILILILCSLIMLVRTGNVRMLRQILIGFFTMVILFSILPSGIKSSFLLKVQNSFQEVSTNSSSFVTWGEINANWRGFEKFQVLQTIRAGKISNWIFGLGLGARVPLPFSISLGGQSYTSLPRIHTSYYYVLFKSGLIGLLCYLLLICRITFTSLSQNISRGKSVLILIGIIALLKGYTEGGITTPTTAFLLMSLYAATLIDGTEPELATNSSLIPNR